jgi:hypothetical protein
MAHIGSQVRRANKYTIDTIDTSDLLRCKPRPINILIKPIDIQKECLKTKKKNTSK